MRDKQVLAYLEEKSHPKSGQLLDLVTYLYVWAESNGSKRFSQLKPHCDFQVGGCKAPRSRSSPCRGTVQPRAAASACFPLEVAGATHIHPSSPATAASPARRQHRQRLMPPSKAHGCQRRRPWVPGSPRPAWLLTRASRPRVAAPRALRRRRLRQHFLGAKPCSLGAFEKAEAKIPPSAAGIHQAASQPRGQMSATLEKRRVNCFKLFILQRRNRVELRWFKAIFFSLFPHPHSPFLPLQQVEMYLAS